MRRIGSRAWTIIRTPGRHPARTRALWRRTKDFVSRNLFLFFQRLGVHVMPVHYYSPIPDTSELRRSLEKWYRPSSLPGIDLNVEGQHRLLEQLRRFKVEYDNLPPFSEISARGYGEGYGEIESQILHAMVRHFKPRRVIEVGSGVSTFYFVNALAANRDAHGINPRMTCIEPHPKQALYQFEQFNVNIIPTNVQDIPSTLFEELDDGDILFIDSTHVVRINGDVNFLFLEVVPTLRPGVLIHVHDVPFPYPTLDPTVWIFQRRMFWTEPALVQAFLAYNRAFEILLCGSYLHYTTPSVLNSTFDGYDTARHFPSCLWVQRLAV